MDAVYLGQKKLATGQSGVPQTVKDFESEYSLEKCQAQATSERGTEPSVEETKFKQVSKCSIAELPVKEKQALDQYTSYPT